MLLKEIKGNLERKIYYVHGLEGLIHLECQLSSNVILLSYKYNLTNIMHIEFEKPICALYCFYYHCSINGPTLILARGSGGGGVNVSGF